MKVAKINIDGYIGGADIQSIFSGEETFNLSKLKKTLENLESDVTDLHVYINSGGGSVTEGWAIYDKLKNCGLNVTTIGEGIVGSIATIIYMAGSTRKLHENTKFFIHNPYWMPDSPTPMEATDLIALGEDLKFEQSKILDFYSKKTGIEVSQIEPLMDKATDLTATQAIEMGFAHSIINEFVNQNKYKLVALINNVKQEKQMENNKQVLSAIDKLTSMFNKAFKSKFVNMSLPVKDAEGNSVELFIESETEDIVQKPAFVKDTDGNNVVAPDGEYTDESGKIIKVIGGLVETVVEPSIEDAELQKLKDELANTLKANEELKASLENALTTNKEMQASFESINKEFVALKKTIIGSGAKFEVEQHQEFSNSKQVETKVSAFDNVAQRIKAKQTK
jgi:ATP-dependent protease ClpP protease subunit